MKCIHTRKKIHQEEDPHGPANVEEQEAGEGVVGNALAAHEEVGEPGAHGRHRLEEVLGGHDDVVGPGVPHQEIAGKAHKQDEHEEGDAGDPRQPAPGAVPVGEVDPEHVQEGDDHHGRGAPAVDAAHHGAVGDAPGHVDGVARGGQGGDVVHAGPGPVQGGDVVHPQHDSREDQEPEHVQGQGAVEVEGVVLLGGEEVHHLLEADREALGETQEFAVHVVPYWSRVVGCLRR
jgi:hypothetical protein